MSLMLATLSLSYNVAPLAHRAPAAAVRAPRSATAMRADDACELVRRPATPQKKAYACVRTAYACTPP